MTAGKTAITNLERFDAFTDTGLDAGSNSNVRIRVQQNGRRHITTVQGLADDLNVRQICKALKKRFSCNGAVKEDSVAGEIIQLSGDQRIQVKQFLTEEEICHKEQIQIMGV